jgi:ATP-dependent Lhr-like helicase
MSEARFSEVTRTWFAERFSAPTRVQELGWAQVAAGAHTLMLAPTGSGKTLAAFLWCLDRLATVPATGSGDRPGYRVVYVSPLKALAYDVEKNLTVPLAGLQAAAARLGRPLAPIRVDVRTGDTPAGERRRQGRDPGDILITTPESLYLLLGSRAREGLRGVETVIVDEIHAVAPSKRGAHLALTLERLSHLVTSSGAPDPQRIGLSATQRPLEVVARFLGGDRPVAVVDAGERPRLDLQVAVPGCAATGPAPEARRGDAPAPPDGRNSLWPAIYPELLSLILGHRSTILFVNSRRLAERLAQQLSELAITSGAVATGEELVRAHHGSVARHEREAIENALKDGRLRAITATSSLELGIDMGAVDLVVQIESPGAVARGLQRIGRAGHHVGGTPKGRIVPKFRGDLLEAAVCARGMREGAVEPIRLPESCLDVLAQQIVAMVAVEPWTVADLERLIRRAAGYASLGRAALTAVLDMLAGKYPSDEFAELRPRLTWDRNADVLTARRGARLIAVTNAGTIPDRGLYGVHLGPGGPRIGELDEEMVYESRPGETFLLGATTWRIEEITRDRVIVSPAPGEPGKMPFWRGEGPGRPIDLGWGVGALCREVDQAAPDLMTRLRTEHALDEHAAANLIAYVAEQRAATGAVPTDRAVTIERFRDEIGDWRVCILTPLGARVHAPWALAIERTLEDRLGYPVQPLVTDDGIALRFADGDDVPGDDELIPDPEEVEDLLVGELARSAVFAGRFRENAARALLLPRRRPGQRTPLWSQRLRAQQLLGVALRYPSFPIVLETYREVLRDVFDVPALIDVLRKIRSRAIRVDGVVTETASPFARSLVFDYVAAYLYEGDAPIAERRAQALTLDRTLLRELLGAEELRSLLDPEVLDEVEAELQARAEERRARHADDVHDLLLRIGDLSSEELAARASEDPAPWIDALARAGRIVAVTIAGAARWIAVEDAARYRDALGTALPPGLPPALLEPAADAVTGLAGRYARSHAPFTAAELAARLGLPAAQAELALSALEARGAVIAGDFRPGRTGREHVDVEVLRQIRRRTLARLRREVSAVPPEAYARFLVRWHGVGAGRRGVAALREALAHLEGVPLSFAELEARILPARVADFQPRMLDELGASGELVWVGHGALGAGDGRVILCRRDRAAALIAPGALAAEVATDLHRAIVDHLRAGGASFQVAIEQAVGVSGEALRAGLWDLVWAGVVSNDTFAPLRSLGAPRGRRVNPLATFGGRWSLVEQLVGAGRGDTARAHARAVSLLDRWGVVGREAATVDDLPGGFAGVADVLRAMEDAGKIRRGYFVDGLAGAQFAWPGAVDRLREPGKREVAVLAATDPASPWGAVLPWPAVADDGARPARRVGALVVLVDGACVLHVDPRGKRLIGFAGAPDDVLEIALRDGLARVAAAARRRTLTLETIDGRPALESRLSRHLERLGARRDYRGLVVAV